MVALSQHAEMVEHMRRHTEARLRAAQRAKAEALGVKFPAEEDDGEPAGG